MSRRASRHDRVRLDLATNAGFLGPDVGTHRREVIDRSERELLQGLWDRALRAVGETDHHGLALAAVGSLARGEAGPLSDDDLVLVHQRRDDRVVAGLAEQLWYPLWDDGVRLDHSVRTPRECRAVAERDLSAAVGLLDLQWVSGDETVVHGVRQAVAADWRANARRRLPELVDVLETRHGQHGDLRSDLEPDLKEGRGGIRDMAVQRALTASWLAQRPLGDADRAYAWLLDVRDAVQVVTGASRAQLRRQDQDTVAALLGLTDADELLARVAVSGRAVGHALQVTLRQARQAQRARTLRVGPRRPRLRPIGQGVYESDGEAVRRTRPVEPDHLTLLRTATAASRAGLPIAQPTLGNLVGHLPPAPAVWSDALRDAFVDLLASGPGLPMVWEQLDLTGVVTDLLPAWKTVRGRPQRSAVHRHTVDRHLVETAVECAARRADVRRPDLLLICALLHDIGKVAGARDHSAEGAPVARGLAERMGLDPQDAAVVERVVREHLTLVELATRRDPTDEGTSASLVQAVGGSVDVLDLLATLTEADAVSAGPQTWTSWRARLVSDLVQQGRRALGGGPSSAPVPPRGHQGHPEHLAEGSLPQNDVEVTDLGGGAFRVQVVDQDRPGLFADIAALLSSRRLSVKSARLEDVGSVVVDSWVVEAPEGETPDADRLRHALERLATGDRSALHGGARSQGTAGGHAVVLPGVSEAATVVEVRAPDRPGLLADLGAAIVAEGVVVRRAYVATYAGQTLDTFYLTDAHGELLEPPRVARVVAALMGALG